METLDDNVTWLVYKGYVSTRGVIIENAHEFSRVRLDSVRYELILYDLYSSFAVRLFRWIYENSLKFSFYGTQGKDWSEDPAADIRCPSDVSEVMLDPLS